MTANFSFQTLLIQIEIKDGFWESKTFIKNI